MDVAGWTGPGTHDLMSGALATVLGKQAFDQAGDGLALDANLEGIGAVSGVLERADADRVFVGSQAGSYFGFEIAAAHVDGSGAPDLVVGAPYQDDGDYDNGAVHFLYDFGRRPRRGGPEPRSPSGFPSGCRWGSRSREGPPMTSTLKRLARIQRIQQDEARGQLVEAERARDDHAARIEQLSARIDEVRTGPADDADDLARRHAFVLRQEMLRRRMVAQEVHLEKRVEARRGSLMQAARAVKVTESFTATLEEREAAHAGRIERKTLDERGLQGWIRRGSDAA